MDETILFNLIRDQVMSNMDNMSEPNKILDNDGINPIVLDRNKIKVYNGSKLEVLTALTIDAASDLKIITESMDGTNVDYYKHVRLLLKYKIEEIEDVDEFLENHPMSYVDNIIHEMNKAIKEYGKPKLI